MIKCPVKSPDINQRKKFWSIWKMRQGEHNRAPTNIDEVWNRVKVKWKNILCGLKQKIVENMKKYFKNTGLNIP